MPKVLVANRGEIAIRILRSASELGWSTVTIYCEEDPSHATFADEAHLLDSFERFMDADAVAEVAVRYNCTHVHPGYGFLSENPALPLALAKANASILFVGPSVDTLHIASDKMLSRDLATRLNIPVAPGNRVQSYEDVLRFAEQAGYPVMIKALDGGGGRGIRIVPDAHGVKEAFQRCLGESPSKRVFAEKALTGPGWKHIEVQIIGDGTGVVNHLWERECSVQRRFQKIVEIAPSRISRKAVQPLLDASLRLAKELRYLGLGTFEYLFNSTTQEWIFLEINPRIQVEHNITEEVMDIDLVRAQLSLFTPGTTLVSLHLSQPPAPPSSYAVQLRITAENPQKNFQLSPGTIHASDVIWPAGRGIRVDTWLTSHPRSPLTSWTVGTELDSVLAKLIVHAPSYEEMTAKSRRALKEVSFVGGRTGSDNFKTNLPVLAGVIDHPDWLSGEIDTLWLERSLVEVQRIGSQVLGSVVGSGKSLRLPAPPTQAVASSSSLSAPGSVLLQPGTLFHLTLSPTSSSPESQPHQQPIKHTLTLSSIGQNAFPSNLTGTLQTSLLPTTTTAPLAFSLSQSLSAAVSSSTSAMELGDPNNSGHICAPLTGKIVELHRALVPSGGDYEGAKGRFVKKGETLVVLSVMKMENAIVAPRDCWVERVGKGVKVGVVVGEGMLLCVVGESVKGRL